MRELVNFVKELLMLKKYDNTYVGLSSFKRASQPVRDVVRKPKNPKEVKLSDLMRRAV